MASSPTERIRKKITLKFSMNGASEPPDPPLPDPVYCAANDVTDSADYREK